MADNATEADSGVEREEFPWAAVAPNTIFGGQITRLFYSGDPTAAQNDNDFGIEIQDPHIVEGTVFENRERGDVPAHADDADLQSSLDYLIASEDDDQTTLDTHNGDVIGVDTGDRTFPGTPSDFADSDTIVLWVGNLAGQFLGRTLDVNGRPSAKYTDDGYIVKGLYQYPEGWWDADSSQRRDMVRGDHAPRAARYPVLRTDVVGDDVYFRMDRDGSINRLDLYWSEEGAVMADEEERLDGRYSEDTVAETLSERDITMHMEHGDGWADEPASVRGRVLKEDTAFDVDVGAAVGEYDGPLTDAQRSFADTVVSALEAEGIASLDALRDGFLADQAGKPSNASELGIDADGDATAQLPMADLREYINDELAAVAPA
jgi:hypothetical protein